MLVDPSLVDVDRVSPDDLYAFWSRIADWNLDKRTRLGPWTFDRYMSLYGRIHEPDSPVIPAGIRRTVQKTLALWLQRGPLADASARVGDTLDVEYLGGMACAEELLADLCSAQGVAAALALATAPEFWREPTPSEVSTILGPPKKVPLHTSPNLPTEADRLDEQVRICQGFRLVIVGGRREEVVVRRIQLELGVDPDRVVWHGSEKHKGPPAMSPIVRGASQTGAIVVCITGAIAHTTMYDLRNGCSRQAVPYLWAKSASDVVDVVSAYAHQIEARLDE